MPKEAVERGDSFGFLDGIGGAPEGIGLPLKYQGRILYNLCRNLVFTKRLNDFDLSPDLDFHASVLNPLPYDDDPDEDLENADIAFCAADDTIAVKIHDTRVFSIIFKEGNSEEASFFNLSPDGSVCVADASGDLHDIDPRVCHELLKVSTTLVAALFEKQKEIIMRKQIVQVRANLAPFFGWEVPDDPVEKS